MLKSLLKQIYIQIIKNVTQLHYRLYRYNVIFLISFNGENNFILQMQKAIKDKCDLTVYYTKKAKPSAKVLKQHHIKTIPLKNNLKFLLHDVKRMMTAKLIFCDNYYPFLAGFDLPPQVKVIQFWHADGAIKQFGWGDSTTKQRSPQAQKRFQAVYNSFTDFIVPSTAMKHIFIKDYHLKHAKFLPFGNPRICKLYQSKWYQRTRQRIYQKLPQLKHKQVVLYAPTYRPGVKLHLPTGLKQVLAKQPNTYIIVSLHPALSLRQKHQIKHQLKAPHILFTNQFSTTQLLTITDTLITDYSSVIFDYSILPNAKSLILFWFDGQQYKKIPGLQPEFLKHLPVKPVYTLQGLTKVLHKHPRTNFKQFNQIWNTDNDAHNISRIINYYCKRL